MRLFKTNQIRFGGIVMLLMLLFLSFNCPHLSLAVESHCNSCVVGQGCRDLCDCPTTPSPHEHLLHKVQTHEFWDNTQKTISFDFIGFKFATDLFEWFSDAGVRPQRSTFLANLSCHSFAVRHLDTIILRV
jgi:hypothetical protein